MYGHCNNGVLEEWGYRVGQTGRNFLTRHFEISENAFIQRSHFKGAGGGGQA